jgi:hypothetical protein
MRLLLVRKEFSPESTIGELSIDDVFECFTLEDAVRPVKIQGKTAIPEGSYEVAITFSNRFQRLLPLLLDVPDFEGVRIHPGNTPRDTEGCILVGTTKGPQPDFIGNSRAAFGILFAKLEVALQQGKVFIDVTGQLDGRPR